MKTKGDPRSYGTEKLKKALNIVTENQLSAGKAANYFKIPRSTIGLHLKGWNKRRQPQSMKRGRPTTFNQAMEKEMAENIKTMTRWGFGLTRKETMMAVGMYVKENRIQNPFKANMPGPKWFRGFKQRWGLSCKKPELIESVRVKQTDPFVIFGFFDLLKEVIEENCLQDKPGQTYNLDESGFCSDPTKTKVVGGIGEPAVRQTSGPARDNTSVLCCVSADGNKLPPLIIYKAKFLWDSWLSKDAYPGTSYATTDEGCMDRSTFTKWFQTMFIPQASKERPLLLIYDGHASHVSLELIEVARQEDIIILKLPPHTTHLLQPLDRTVFGPVKVLWDKKLVEWQRENYGTKLSKATFSKLLGETWSEVRSSSVISGFRKTGIFDDRIEFPVNRKAIPDSSFNPSKLDSYRMSKVNPTAEAMEVSSDVAGPSISVAARSFEDILLSKVGQSLQPKQKRSRVNNMAEVITREAFVENLEKKEAERLQTLLNKGNKRGRTIVSKSKSRP